MKRAILIHCWGGQAQYAWYPWAKAELENRGYTVEIPDMPHTDEPQLSEWLPVLQSLVGLPDDELLLIGHSLGTVTIMRYLESLPYDQQIGNAILVAGFTDQLGFTELENFFETRLDFPSVKRAVAGTVIAVQSDNDAFVSEQYGQRLQTELQATLIIKHAGDHMSGALDAPDGYHELPEFIQALDTF